MCSVVFIIFHKYLLLGDSTGVEGPLTPPGVATACERSAWPVASSSKLGYKLPQALLVPPSGKPNWSGDLWGDREMEGFGTDAT